MWFKILPQKPKEIRAWRDGKKNTVYVRQRLSDGNITACGW